MKTILVLIDGLCAEALQHTDTPNIDKIIQKGAFSLQCQTVFPPVTLPAHVSLFTSLDPEQHGIHDNSPPPPQSLALTFFDLATRKNRQDGFLLHLGKFENPVTSWVTGSFLFYEKMQNHDR